MYRSLALVGVLILAVLGFLYVKVYLQSAGYLSGVLSDVDVQERIKAAETLSKMGEGAAPAAAALVAALQDESPAVKNYARAALEGLGGRQAEALPHLIKAIHGEQADAKVMAIGVIAKMGEAGRSAGPALIVAFKDKDASVRRAAVGALAQVAPGKETVDEMFAMLADKDGGVREEAGRALREAAKSDAEVMDRLVACAKDKKGAEQLAAVKTLGDFGPLAAPAAAVLRDLAASPAASLAIASLTALRRVAPDAPESVAVFTAALGRREDNIKATAAEALLALAAKDGKAAAALRQALPTLPKNTQSRVEQALKAVK
ncbi:MAG TPA: HEAT repeat domain-containing protein [Candidatus Brocadiia bacterium]|nr:HEAT repeat domain-containing protein [Candidatus Brocadiia bacterium]